MRSEAQLELFRGRIAEHSLPHAFLVTGQDSAARRAFAADLAKAFFFYDDKAATRIEEGSYEDLIFVEKQEDSIKAEQIGALSAALKNKPFVAKGMMAVISDGDAMTEESQNKLLKTLEEPNAGNLLVILAENPERLFATIRSRCVPMKIDGALAPEEDAVYEAAKTIISTALFERRKPLQQIFALLEPYTEQKEAAEALLSAMERFLRDLVVGGYAPALLEDRRNQAILERMSQKWERRFRKYVTIIEDTRSDLNRRMNRKNCLRALTVKFRQEAIHG